MVEAVTFEPVTFENFPIPADPLTMPTDTDIPPDEGDDGTTLTNLESELPSLIGPEMMRAPQPTHPRFPRILKEGDRGRDVLALERALIRAKIRTFKADGVWDYRTTWGVRQFQHQQGLKVTGIVNHETWRHFNYPIAGPGYASGKSLFDAYGFWLVNHPKAPSAPKPSSVAEAVVHAAWYSYLNAALIHYYQGRPMTDMQCPPQLDEYMDCSEAVTLWMMCGGAPDPSGLGYDGYGNTDTILAHSHGITGDPKPADMVLYANPGHVALVVKWPMVISHGSEGGPYYLDARYRTIQAFRRCID